MEGVAEQKGFDPLIPNNWYSQDFDEIRSMKVIIFIAFLYLLYYKILTDGFRECRDYFCTTKEVHLKL